MGRSKKRKSAQVSSNSDDSEKESESRVVDEGGVQIGDIYIPPPPPAISSLDSTAPRLMIERIENKNFKSYAGVQHLGPFHKCFSSIIGPNGSGKSNVIDSMLFVFGYRGSKIRSKKISSLIHNSENHKSIQSCTVTVYFKLIIDKDDDFEEVPDSQFKVSRTGFKDNSSTYEIDGRRVAFKEVAIRLKKHGIDLDHNRFLILQGEVEQIAMMKPKGQGENDTGMLEYLEDIIGTSRFKEPIEKLHVVVNELNDDRAAKVQKVELVGKEKNDMQGAYEEAIEFLKTENYITELRNTEYQKYIYDAELTKKQKEEKEGEVLKDLDALKKTINDLQKERKEIEKKVHDCEKKKEKMKEKLDNLNKLYAKIEEKDNTAMAEMVQTNDRRKLAKTKLAEDTRKLSELEKIPEANTADIKQIEKKLVKMVEEKEDLEAKKAAALEEQSKQTRPLQKQRDALEKKLVEFKAKAGEITTDITGAETELKMLTKSETDANRLLNEHRETYKTRKMKFEENRRIAAECEEKIEALTKELNAYNTKLLPLKEKYEASTTKLDALGAKLSESRSSMQQTRSRGRVLDAIMRLKNEGKMPGVFGRLGDLGAIDPKYDVAVSTACGPLDHIVVDTVQTAQKCIKFLQDNSIGRGWFLALEKQENLRKFINNRSQTPENVPRLFDLIQVKDERMRTAFYFGVRETLVANDLEQATRIAYGKVRHRVVSLTGDLIETVGTMSGGGKTVARGRMGTKVLVDTASEVTPEKVAEMEREVQELTEKVQRMQNEIDDLEPKVAEVTKGLNKEKMTLNSAKLELQTIVKLFANSEKQIEHHEKVLAAVVTDKSKEKELEKRIENLKAEFEEVTQSAQKVKEEADEISKEINSTNGGKVEKLQSRLTELIECINKLKAESTKLSVAIKSSERNAVKCKERIANAEETIETDSARLLVLQSERDEIEADAKKLLESIEDVKKKLSEDNSEEVSKYKQEVAQMTKEENKLKEDTIALEHTLTTIRSTIKEFVSSLAHWRKVLSKLTFHEIPDNEVEMERSHLTPNISVRSEISENASIAGSTNLSRLSNKNDTPNKKKELRTLTEEELKSCNVVDIQYTITCQQDKLSKKPNLNVIEEYKKVQVEYCKRVREVEEVTKRRKLYRDTLDKVKKTRETEFLTGYQIINLKLKEMYQMITLGGDAELELVDSLDPFNDGVSFGVRPPKKSWKNICNLSGGEKTLSSLALVFALHYYKPSPLYVMDEIDAALDFKNVSIVGNYIKERTKNAQFIIISLRSNMFELADRLVGIYKTENCTKSCAVNPGPLHEMLAKCLNTLQITPPSTQQLSQAITQSQQTQVLTHIQDPQEGDDLQKAVPGTSALPHDESFNNLVQA